MQLPKIRHHWTAAGHLSTTPVEHMPIEVSQCSAPLQNMPSSQSLSVVQLTAHVRAPPAVSRSATINPIPMRVIAACNTPNDGGNQRSRATNLDPRDNLDPPTEHSVERAGGLLPRRCSCRPPLGTHGLEL